MTIRLITVTAALLTTAACEAPVERPMDEVPQQITLPNGDRRYGFRGNCVVVLEPQRAVVKSEAQACELHHRDIALLYASGD